MAAAPAKHVPTDERHFPSTPAVTMRAMFVARLICSDTDCAEEQEVHVGTLAELERLLCDCGCALEVIAWPDWADAEATVITLRRRGSGGVDPALPAAA